VKKRFEPGKTALVLILINLVQVALIGAVLLYFIDTDKGTELLSNPLSMVVLTVLPSRWQRIASSLSEAGQA
jgi:F0F1-type ATP synthase assembly protein I